jgi:alpha-D-ribose 1-methylphosphonate 5-triphosphate diphosphatase
MRTYLTRARLVLPEKVIHDGEVLLEDDRILEVCPEAAPRAKVVDLDGQWLLPGLVDMHCDALEKDIEPRPNVLFPLPLAIASADRRNAAAGITTVYHALSFAHGELGVRNVDLAVDIAAAVNL